VTEIQPIVPLAMGIGLGFAILSYDGSLAICINSDPDLVPDADGLRRHLEGAVGELAGALGVDAAPKPVPARESGAPPVSALMTERVVTVDRGDSLALAWELMRRNRIRHLPVTDATGVLQGLVTHRDLLAAAESSLAVSAADRLRHLEGARVGDVMETHVSAIGPDTPAASAGLRMVAHKIGCLPVTARDGRLVGIVTEEDYVRWAALRMAAANGA
jgi:CBS domain-containing protein